MQISDTLPSSAFNNLHLSRINLYKNIFLTYFVFFNLQFFRYYIMTLIQIREIHTIVLQIVSKTKCLKFLKIAFIQ